MKRYIAVQELGQLYVSDITYPNVGAFCQEHTWISSVLFIELAHSKYLRSDLAVLGWCFFIFQLILLFFNSFKVFSKDISSQCSKQLGGMLMIEAVIFIFRTGF